jgi:hypothetical protein
MPTTFTSDTFGGTAGTDLAGQSATAGTWVEAVSTGDVIISTAGRARIGTTSFASFYYVNQAPGTADYDVIADVVRVGTQARPLGPGGRLASNGASGYAVNFNDVSDQWELHRITSTSASSVLGTWVNAPTIGVAVSVKLEMRGTAIKVYMDGTERISVTDGNVTAAGFAGLFGYASSNGSDSSGSHVDNLVAQTPDAASGGPFPFFSRRVFVGGMIRMGFGG